MKRSELRALIKEVIAESLYNNHGQLRSPTTKEPLNSPADIPNQVGFQLVVVFKDGKELKTIVQKRQDGTHHLTGVTDWSKVLGWKKKV